MRTYGSLRHHEGTWVMKAEPHVVMRLKRVFGRISPTRSGELVISDTRETSFDLEWALDRYPLEMDEMSAGHLRRQAAGYREAQAAIERFRLGERLSFERQPACERRDYQMHAADHTLATGRLLLCDDLGLGKSFSALMMLRHPDSLPALIVCPTHLPPQWAGYVTAAFPDLVVHIARRTQAYDPAQLRGRLRPAGSPDVMIVPYSKLQGWAENLAGVVRTVVFDEAQELRHAGTEKYKAAGRIADGAYFKMGTTTTPVYNYGGEAFNVLDVIAQGSLGTRAEFVQEWGAEMSNGRMFVRQPGALGTHLRAEGLLMARTRKDVGLELPGGEDPIQVPWQIGADEATLEAEIEGVVHLARMILAGGGSKEDRFRAGGDLDWQLRRATGLAKAPFVAAFVKMLLESEPKVLLLGWHRDVYDAWNTAFTRAGIGSAMYTGSESPAQKERAKRLFLEDPYCRVLMMSLRSGSGLDGLQQVCRVAVFGELDWSPGQHKQVMGRLHRDGQADEVVGYFLHCDYGSDPVVMETLGIKRGQAEPIRDPDAPLFQAVDNGDRVRRLAEAALQGRHLAVPQKSA